MNSPPKLMLFPTKGNANNDAAANTPSSPFSNFLKKDAPGLGASFSSAGQPANNIFGLPPTAPTGPGLFHNNESNPQQTKAVVYDLPQQQQLPEEFAAPKGSSRSKPTSPGLFGKAYNPSSLSSYAEPPKPALSFFPPKPEENKQASQPTETKPSYWILPPPPTTKTDDGKNESTKSSNWFSTATTEPNKSSVSFLGKTDNSQQDTNKPSTELQSAAKELFGGPPSNPGSLFGNPTASPANIFNNPPPATTSSMTTNLFGTPTTGTPNYFANSTSTAPAAFFANMGKTDATATPSTTSTTTPGANPVPSFLNPSSAPAPPPTPTSSLAPKSLFTNNAPPLGLFNNNGQSTQPAPEPPKPKEYKKDTPSEDPDRPIKITNPKLIYRIKNNKADTEAAKQASTTGTTTSTPTPTIFTATTSPITSTPTSTIFSVTPPASTTSTTTTQAISLNNAPSNQPSSATSSAIATSGSIVKSSIVEVPQTTPVLFPKSITSPSISSNFSNPPQPASQPATTQNTPSQPFFIPKTTYPPSPTFPQSSKPAEIPDLPLNDNLLIRSNAQTYTNVQNNRTYSFNYPAANNNAMEISQSSSDENRHSQNSQMMEISQRADNPPMETSTRQPPGSMELSVSIPKNKPASASELFKSMVSRSDHQHPSSLQAFEILQKICSLIHDEQRLREFVFTVKPIQNFIFLQYGEKFPISFSNFTFPRVPAFPTLPLECKQHLFYLFEFFTLQTALPPESCLPAFYAFLLKSNYMARIVNPDNTPNVLYIKNMYDVSEDGQIVALRFHSEYNYRIQTAILNYYSSRNRLALQCINIASKHINSNEFALLIKDDLYKNLWYRYFGMYHRIREVISREINPTFIENFLVEQKMEQKMLIKMLAQLVYNFPTVRAANRGLVLKIIAFIDKYMKLDNDIRIDVIKKYSEDEIQIYHQHCLIFLLDLDRLKKPVKKPNVWTEIEKLYKVISDTTNSYLAPFRDIIPVIMKILYDKDVRQKNIDFKKVLENVQQPQWFSWAYLYILKVERQLEQYPKKTEFMRMLMSCLKKIFREPRNLALVWRLRDSEGESGDSNIVYFLRRLKETQEVKYRFTLASILMGNHYNSYVNNVLKQEFFDGSDWYRQIFKGMIGRISDFYRSRMMPETSRLQQYQMEKEYVDAKVVFLMRILYLAPDEADSIYQQMFGRMTDRQGIDRNQGPIKCMLFIMDCLKYYSLDQHLDFRILKYIFRAINSIIASSNPGISNTLFLAIGICYWVYTRGHAYAYPHLKFLYKMQKNIADNQVRKLATEIKKHVDLLLCNVDILRLLPDVSNHKPYSLETMRLNFNNRYNLTSRQIQELKHRIKVSGYHASSWIRTVMEIVKVGAIDFSFIERLLRKFLFCPSAVLEQPPKLLKIIYDAINVVDFVEAAVETLEVVSINPNTTYVRIQGNPFNVYNKKYLASGVDGEASRMAYAKKKIQEALKLLHTTMNIALAVSVTNKSSSDITKNFLVKLLKDSKFFGTLDRRFLSKASLYTYRDLTSITQNINFNIVETLFAHVNFEQNRGQVIENNPSYEILQYHWLLEDRNDWYRHKDYRVQEDLTRLYNAFIKEQPHIDWQLLVNPLYLPSDKSFECRESVSANALRCIGSLIQLWQQLQSSQQLSLYECLVGSQMSNNIFAYICQEFLKILDQHRERSLYANLILYILTISATKHTNFMDLMIQSPNQQDRNLYKFMYNFLANGQQPVIFYKVVNLLAYLLKKRTTVMQQAEKRHDIGGLCELLVKKLQEMVRSNQPQNFYTYGYFPSQLFYRHQLYRQYYKFLSVSLAVEKVVWILLSMYLKKYTRVLGALNNLFKFLLAEYLFIPQPNQQNIGKSEDYINRCLMESCPVFNFKNILQDALEKYYKDDVEANRHELPSKIIKEYFEIQRSNIIYYYDYVRIRLKFAVNKLLLVILSTGRYGYLMSTISMHIDDYKCGKFLCHKHQPKMVDGFCKIISSGNPEQAVETLHNICIDLLTAMKKYPKLIDYHLSIRLLSASLQAIMGLCWHQKDAAKELVSEMLNSLHWLSDDEDMSIRNIRTALLTTDLLNLHNRLNMSSDLLNKITQVVENSLQLDNIDKQFRAILLNMTIHFTRKSISPNILLNSMDQENPILFHHACRVICEESKKNAEELCQRGLLDLIYKNRLLANITEKTNFYNYYRERNPYNICWLWTLNVMKSLIMNSDRSNKVYTDVMKIVTSFQKRIFSVLSIPTIVAAQQVQPLSLAYMEYLSLTVGLVATLFLDPVMLVQSNRYFFYNILYFVMHYTIDLYRPNKTMNSIYQPVSYTYTKLYSTHHSKSYTFQRQQLNFKYGSHKGVRSDDSYRPNMFIYTIEHLQVEIATNLAVIIARGLPLSQIVEKYFYEPIDRYFGNHYQSLFWNRMNRCLPLLQQYLDFTSAKWLYVDSEQLLSLYREVHETPYVFMSNGYLSSMFVHPTRKDLFEIMAFAAVMSCQAGESYMLLQLKYNSRYFSLMLEDLHQLKSLYMQILRSFEQKMGSGSSDWKNMLLTISAKIDRIRIM